MEISIIMLVGHGIQLNSPKCINSVQWEKNTPSWYRIEYREPGRRSHSQQTHTRNETNKTKKNCKTELDIELRELNETRRAEKNTIYWLCHWFPSTTCFMQCQSQRRQKIIVYYRIGWCVCAVYFCFIFVIATFDGRPTCEWFGRVLICVPPLNGKRLTMMRLLIDGISWLASRDNVSSQIGHRKSRGFIGNDICDLISIRFDAFDESVSSTLFRWRTNHRKDF